MGEITVRGIRVVDTPLGVVALNTTVLAPGKVAGGTISKTIINSDYPEFSNSAIANATSCKGTSSSTDVVTMFIIKPDISLDKTSRAPHSGALGNIIYFNLTVRNSGDSQLRNVIALDLLPRGLSFNSVGSNPYPWDIIENTNGTTTIIYDLGDIDSGGSVPLTLAARVNGDRYGEVENYANVTGIDLAGSPVRDDDDDDVVLLNISFTNTSQCFRNVQFAASAANGTAPYGYSWNFGDGSTGSGQMAIHKYASSGDFNVTLTVIDAVSHSGTVSRSIFVPEPLQADAGADKYISRGESVTIGASPTASKGYPPYSYLWSPAGSLDSSSAPNPVAKPLQTTKYTVNVTDAKLCEASDNMTVYVSDITVSKTADPTFGSPSTNVVFSLLVTNSGGVPLQSVFVSDRLPMGMSYVSSNPVGVVNGRFINWSNIGPLAAGESMPLEVVAHIDVPVSGFQNLVNRVDVAGKPVQGGNVTNNTSTTVQAQEANISVTKTASPTFGSPSTDVTFTLVVKNTGKTNLTSTFVSDLLPVGMSYRSSQGGVNNGRYVNWSNIGRLAPDESTSLQIVAHIDGPVVGLVNLTNRVDVEGKPDHGHNVTNNTTTVVMAQKANISVTKTASPTFGSPSTDVTFTLVVKNTGKTNLTSTSVSDLLPVGMSYRSSQGGVNNGRYVNWSNIGRLAPDESTSLQIVAHIDGPVVGLVNLTNRVDVEGKPDHGGNVTANATASVQAQEAKISVTKTADPVFGSPSTDVAFTLVVKNIGNTNLTQVFVSDLLPVGMSYRSSNGGVNNSRYVNWSNIGRLAPDESKPLQIVAHIDGPVVGLVTLTNRVDVEGKPDHGGNVTANDTASVQAQEAKISVTKTADPVFGSPSTDVTFTLVVKNTGKTNLTSTFVSDLLPMGMSYRSSQGGVNNGRYVNWSNIGRLAPDESKPLQIVAHIDGPVVGLVTLTNRVDVEGKPDHGGNVTATATASVEAQEPKITVSKTSNLSYGSPCTDVAFTLVVKNTGKSNLTSTFVSDLLPLGMSYRSSDGGSSNGRYVNWSNIGYLGPGESKSLGIVAHIDGPISGLQPLVNRVDVEGKPDHGNNVTNNTTTVVVAQEAKISVTKTADPTFGSPSTDVTFTLAVKNTGKTNLTSVFVSDLLPVGMSYRSSDGGVNNGRYVNWSNIGRLAPDESKPLQIVAHIDGPVVGLVTLTNRVDVEGKPDHGGNVTDYDTATVQAQEAKISVTKTADPTFGSPGTDVTFNLVVKNTGNTNLTSVFVSALLPVGMSYRSSDGGVNNGRYVNWSNIGRLAPEESIPLQIVAHIDGPFVGLVTLTNRVDVEGKPDHGGNVTDYDTATVQAQEAKISVTKTADPTFGSPGTNVTFTLVVKNTGNANLTNVFVSDLLPMGMSYRSSNGGTRNSQYINWSNIGRLAPDESKSLQIVAQIDGPVVGLVTLTNRVDVEGKPDHGGNVTANATAIVQAQEAKISVTKKADPALGSPGTWVNFTMNVTNTANSELVNVTASDDLPAGLIYQSSSPGGINSGQNVLWPEIGPMDVGQIKRLWILALVDNSAHGTLTNVVNVEGRPEQGDSVRDRATADVLVLNASINVTKSAFPPDGIPGTEMVFTIVVNNTGEADLILTELRDTLPDGLAYLGDDHNGTFVDPNVVLWHDLGILPAGETITILMSTEVVGTIIGELDNLVDVIAVPVTGGQPVVSKSIAKVEAKPVPYVVTKKADKSTYKPGEEITYTITVCNTMQYIDMTDVVVKDVFEDPIEIIGTYPQASNDGTWYIDRIPGWQNGKSESCVEMIVVARAPKANTTFDLEQSVSGSGFVNVHNDVSTSIEPYDVKNCVYVSARVATETWNLSTCTSVTIQDLGTELDTREHGSGQYATEEKTRLIWQNKSIQSLKNVSAAYHPTTFLLPADRALNYASKWTEESRAKNYVTGAVMHETYRYADRVDRNTYVKMDENGSKMAIDASFVGKGSIGFYKKSNPDSGPKIRPIFESQQDYSGSFRINETFDEYGKNTRLMREVTGEGFASADQRIRSSQRSYEHGSGSYRSEELTDSVSNYMSKDIEVAHKPVSYNYSPTLQANQNLKWSEGMISKSGILRGGEIFAGNNSAGGELDRECIVSTAGTAPATVISEKFSSLEYMKKETVALGLNEMKTNATFQGVADFRAKSVGANGTGKVDDEERYVGSFDVSRHVLLTGVSRYDYPHITVSKVGIPRNELVNAINSTVINYTITVTNDGNRALAPVYVKDIFPAGTEYVSSSYRPSALSTTEANWTLLHIGIGDSQTISLKLNLTESAPANVLNCVEVAGITGGTLVSSFNCSLVQSDWMPCCPPKVAVEKKAEIDSVDATIVRYTVALKNNANSSMAVRNTDEIPGGMSLMQSSIQPYSTDSNRIVWAFGDFRPGEVKIIEYRMKAARNGAFTNRVHVTADALDGTGSSSADASAYIHVTGTGNAPYTTRYSGWQPPDWDMNTSEEGLTI